jgi:hypothetical protein
MTDPATPTAPSSRPRRWAGVLLWIGQAVLALVLVGAAFAKFGADPTATASFEAIGAGVLVRNLTGVTEIAAAVGLLVPLLAGAAAIGTTVLLTAAVAVEALRDGGAPVVPLVPLVLAVIVVIGRRASTVRLWRAVTGRARGTGTGRRAPR